MDDAPHSTSSRKCTEIKKDVFADIFNIKAITSERDNLIDASTSVLYPKDFKVPTLQELAENVKTIATGLASAESIISDTTNWTSSQRKMIIDVVFSSAAKHKTYAASAFLLSVILKALRAQRCHIIVAVSDWMTNTGPKMIEDMCNCYKHKEYDGLVQRDPAFAKFIHHCILYLKTTQALKKPGHVTKPDT